MPPRKITSPVDALQLKLGFNKELKDKIVSAAEKSRRSLTAEVIYRLEKTFDREGLLKLAAELDEQPKPKLQLSMREGPPVVRQSTGMVVEKRPKEELSEQEERLEASSFLDQLLPESRDEPTASRSRSASVEEPPHVRDYSYSEKHEPPAKEIDARLKRLEESQTSMGNLLKKIVEGIGLDTKKKK